MNRKQSNKHNRTCTVGKPEWKPHWKQNLWQEGKRDNLTHQTGSRFRNVQPENQCVINANREDFSQKSIDSNTEVNKKMENYGTQRKWKKNTDKSIKQSAKKTLFWQKNLISSIFKIDWTEKEFLKTSCLQL